MPLTLDTEIASLLAASADAGAQMEAPPPGDVLALRAFTEATIEAMFAQLPDTPDVEMTVHTADANGGVVPLRCYSRTGTNSKAAVIYVHGGGMVCGTAALYDRFVRRYVQLTGVSFLSVDYRLAPEYSATGLAQDVFAALNWLRGESAAMNIDPARIAIMGESGGGGVAAATAIVARDNGIALARQILVYPMLDDRNVEPDPLLVPMALWSYEANLTAWKAVLGDALGGKDVSPYIAPARLGDFSGLAPAYIEVGELDIFRDESLSYAQNLVAAGVSCEFHMHPGAPHAYDFLGTALNLTRRVLDDRVRIINSL